MDTHYYETISTILSLKGFKKRTCYSDFYLGMLPLFSSLQCRYRQEIYTDKDISILCINIGLICNKGLRVRIVVIWYAS